VTDEVHAALADLGYEGERAALTTPIKKTADAPLSRYREWLTPSGRLVSKRS